MKIETKFDVGLRIISPRPIKLWGRKEWSPEKVWLTGPCQWYDDRYYTYDGETRTLSCYHSVQDAEPKRIWILPEGTTVETVQVN